MDERVRFGVVAFGNHTAIIARRAMMAANFLGTHQFKISNLHNLSYLI